MLLDLRMKNSAQMIYWNVVLVYWHEIIVNVSPIWSLAPKIHLNGLIIAALLIMQTLNWVIVRKVARKLKRAIQRMKEDIATAAEVLLDVPGIVDS